MEKKILVPTDGSDIAQAAGAAAVEFARACGSELFVLSVARATYLMPSDASAMTSNPGVGVLEHAQVPVMVPRPHCQPPATPGSA